MERNVKNSEITELCQLSQKSRVIFSFFAQSSLYSLQLPLFGVTTNPYGMALPSYFRFYRIWFYSVSGQSRSQRMAKDFPLNFMLIMPLSSWATFKRVSSLSALALKTSRAERNIWPRHLDGAPLMQTDLRWLQEIKSPIPLDSLAHCDKFAHVGIFYPPSASDLFMANCL